MSMYRKMGRIPECGCSDTGGDRGKGVLGQVTTLNKNDQNSTRKGGRKSNQKNAAGLVVTRIMRRRTQTCCPYTVK